MTNQICINTWEMYNDGKVMGFWYDLGSLNNDDLQQLIEEKLEGEEVFIIDTSFEADLGVGEGDNIFDINEWFCDFVDCNMEAVGYLIYDGEKLTDIDQEKIDGVCFYDDAEDYIKQIHEIPEHLENYVDYDSMASDYGLVEYGNYLVERVY